MAQLDQRNQKTLLAEAGRQAAGVTRVSGIHGGPQFSTLQACRKYNDAANGRAARQGHAVEAVRVLQVIVVGGIDALVGRRRSRAAGQRRGPRSWSSSPRGQNALGRGGCYRPARRTVLFTRTEVRGPRAAGPRRPRRRRAGISHYRLGLFSRGAPGVRRRPWIGPELPAGHRRGGVGQRSAQGRSSDRVLCDSHRDPSRTIDVQRPRSRTASLDDATGGPSRSITSPDVYRGASKELV